MSIFSADILERIKQLPPVLALRKRRYERAFSSTAVNSFRGVYQSFEQALATAPETKAKGFDVQEFEGYFDNRRDELFLYDYPFLYWLCRILRPDSYVFDIGGNTGVHFMSYRKRLPHWEQLRWEVCEVPVIVDEGKRFAEREGYSDRLTFTSEFNDADGKDVVLSAGTLQYIDMSLADMLSALDNPPQHILVNKLPLYDGEPYVTLQNGGVHFIAQRVFNRAKFLGELTELGYQLSDHWVDNSRSCRVPFHPERDVPNFTGLYLSKRHPGDANP
jgi:putative methyltransferase (TIGR04325 family)